MSNLSLAWQAISPTPVTRGALVEPEATNHVAPQPWLHFPPGAALLLIACTTLLFMAAFQSSVNIVRRDGLRDGIREGIADTIPIQLDMLDEQPLTAPVAGGAVHHRRARTHHAIKLHRLLQQARATPWSNDRSERSASNLPAPIPVAAVSSPVDSALAAP